MVNNLRFVVELFRYAKLPNFSEGSFSAEIKYTHETKLLFKKILSPGFGSGSFNDLEIDGIDIDNENDLPDAGEVVSFSFIVTQGSAERFYSNKEEFLKINSLKRGEIPSSYYIVNDDFSSSDATKPEYIIKIEKVCYLITALSKLAHFHDIKQDSNVSLYRLVFILQSPSTNSTAVIETTLTDKIFLSDELDLGIIRSLITIEPSSDLHYEEKLNTFRNTLIEYIKANNCDFPTIIECWKEINTLYSNNLAVYMSAFSFHKARKEVADAEIEYADKISKVIADLSNKALAIPISLVASIATFQLTGKAPIIISLAGIILTSLITTFISLSHKSQLDRICHAKEIIFSAIENRIIDEKSDLKIKLLEAKRGLNENETFCRRVLHLLLLIGWIPTSIGFIGVLNSLI